ncbi:MAG: methyltransferase domain-containing protein [Planctomycetota bacterium]|nr:methyltransferase domain-containing protein [Planctomycetota bacterium]
MSIEKTRGKFDDWAESGAGDQLESSHGDVVEQVIDAMDIRPGERILDLGCGTGWATRILAQRAPGAQAVGVDVSPKMIARADELHSLRIRARYDVGSFEELDFPEASFDRVFSMEAIYYAQDLDRALSELCRVLKPGGAAEIVVDYFADSPGTAVWGELLDVKMHFLVADEWRRAFERAGFGDVTTSRVIDRRGPGDPAGFEPNEWTPDWETKLSVHENGSLWIHAEKPSA